MMNIAILKWGVLCVALLAAGLTPLPRREVSVRIGSKKFTESVILGEMLRLLVVDAGLSAAHYREFGGTRIVFQALQAGEIDAYPEYTGTIVQEILAGQAVPDEEAIRRELHARGIGMSDSLGFSNSYALALTRKRAEALGIKKISDLRRLPELRLALTHEFLDRSDGWGALREAMTCRSVTLWESITISRILSSWQAKSTLPTFIPLTQWSIATSWCCWKTI